MITGEEVPEPVIHGGIIEAVINDDDGHLIITYEDGHVADLGVVVGADGAQGPAGPQGPKR